MIVSRIQGGLGNQMFQYAYGRYLAQRYDTQLWLECSHSETDTLRNFALDRWRIAATPVEPAISTLLPRRYGGRGWSNLLQGQTPLRRVKERPFGFQQKYLNPGSRVFLDGYWQSEQFFPGMRDTLQREFQPARKLSPATLAVARQMEANNSVSLHVRRGDYITNQHANSVHGVCTLEYYRRSVQQLLARLEAVQVFVFSDDHAWCAEHLALPCATKRVTHNAASSDHEDVWLMTQCRHHVVANSSFSWWGAWLGVDPTGLVYAPEPWFRSADLDCRSVVPASWNRIENEGTTLAKAA